MVLAHLYIVAVKYLEKPLYTIYYYTANRIASTFNGRNILCIIHDSFMGDELHVYYLPKGGNPMLPLHRNSF